jgi:hypothetical protein
MGTPAQIMATASRLTLLIVAPIAVLVVLTALAGFFLAARIVWELT